MVTRIGVFDFDGKRSGEGVPKDDGAIHGLSEVEYSVRVRDTRKEDKKPFEAAKFAQNASSSE